MVMASRKWESPPPAVRYRVHRETLGAQHPPGMVVVAKACGESRGRPTMVAFQIFIVTPRLVTDNYVL